MPRVAIFSEDSEASQEIASTVHLYVKEVLGVESHLSATAMQEKNDLGFLFNVVSGFQKDMDILQQDAEIHLFDWSPIAMLGWAHRLLDLYRDAGLRDDGVRLAHQIIFLEDVIPGWIAAQNLNALYYYPGGDEGESPYFRALADQFGAHVLPADIDQAIDEVGTFVEDILGMNPGE